MRQLILNIRDYGLRSIKTKKIIEVRLEISQKEVFFQLRFTNIININPVSDATMVVYYF